MGGGSLHKKDWLKIGGALAATALTAGAAAPLLAGGEAAAAAAAAAAAEGGAGGAAAIGAGAAGGGLAGASTGLLPTLATAAPEAAAGSSAAGLFGAAPSVSQGLSSAAFQSMGHMGAEQAGILAAQNAGMGVGADAMTLASANPGSAGFQAASGLFNSAPTIGKTAQGLSLAKELMPQQQAPGVAGARPMQPGPPSKPGLLYPDGGGDVSSQFATMTPEQKKRLLAQLQGY